MLRTRFVFHIAIRLSPDLRKRYISDMSGASRILRKSVRSTDIVNDIHSYKTVHFKSKLQHTRTSLAAALPSRCFVIAQQYSSATSVSSRFQRRYFIFQLLQQLPEFNNCPTRCDLFSLSYFCRQLYMFRVLTPIIRSSYNCNYSFWY